jgi:hypothetical protein
MTLHACTVLLHAFIGYALSQGHPYSNDNDEPSGPAPRWFYWLVIVAIGVGVGIWLKSGDRRK